MHRQVKRISFAFALKLLSVQMEILYSIIWQSKTPVNHVSMQMSGLNLFTQHIFYFGHTCASAHHTSYI